MFSTGYVDGDYIGVDCYYYIVIGYYGCGGGESGLDIGIGSLWLFVIEKSYCEMLGKTFHSVYNFLDFLFLRSLYSLDKPVNLSFIFSLRKPGSYCVLYKTLFPFIMLNF